MADEYSLKLDSALEQHVMVGQPTELDFTGDLTVECRFMLFSAPIGSGGHVLVERGFYDGTWDASFQLHIYDHAGGDAVRFRVETGTGTLANAVGGVYLPSSDLTLNRWYTIRGSYDASARVARLFIDGVYIAFTVSETAGSGTSRHLGVGNLLFGRRGVAIAPGPMDGRISHIIIANDYVTAHDIANYPLDVVPDHTDYDISGIVGYWKLDSETDGVVVDEVNGISGTLEGDTEPVLTAPFPWLLGSADFEAGDTEAIETSTGVDLQFTGSFSVGGWFKFESTGAQQYLITRWEATHRAFGLYRENDGTIQLIVYSADANFRYWWRTDNAVPIGQWVHIFAAIDVTGPATKIFINRIEVDQSLRDSNSFGGNVNWHASQKFGIGGAYGTSWGSNFDGLAAQCRLYNSYIIDEEVIKAEMHAKRSTHANLVEEWPLTHKDGTTFRATNGNDGEETSGTIPAGPVDHPPLNLGGTYAMELDGTTNICTFQEIDVFDGLGTFTFDAWVYITQNATGAILCDYRSQSPGDNRSFYFILLAGNSIPRVQLWVAADGGGTSADTWETADVVTLNEWHHIRVSVDLGTDTVLCWVDNEVVNMPNTLVVGSGADTTLHHQSLGAVTVGMAHGLSGWNLRLYGKIASVLVRDTAETGLPGIVEPRTYDHDTENAVFLWDARNGFGITGSAYGSPFFFDAYDLISFHRAVTTVLLDEVIAWTGTPAPAPPVIPPAQVTDLRRKMCNLINS